MRFIGDVIAKTVSPLGTCFLCEVMLLRTEQVILCDTDSDYTLINPYGLLLFLPASVAFPLLPARIVSLVINRAGC